jgi:hypothetical protein
LFSRSVVSLWVSAYMLPEGHFSGDFANDQFRDFVVAMDCDQRCCGGRLCLFHRVAR